ncbi:protein-L-isoaspartate O-methyltransferase [Embleya sp. NPDC008237]|uniref:protein-L-isoaspartate O-methyltransferase family protein n=1 Tax=Embleya sp. NPDC008237 TaxID=3363978 RepID=UPI0036F12B44
MTAAPTATTTWHAHARALAELLATEEPDLHPAVPALFTRVPRHLFLPGRYRAGQYTPVDHTAGTYPDDLLESTYRNTSHITHHAIEADPARRTSSCSQPSVMAAFLDVIARRHARAPIRRALEVGAGTGFHAALIAELTGATVHTLDAAQVIVDEANASLTRADHTGRVTAHPGDGYLGLPDHGPYDLIVATCGVIGASPHWLDQLAPDGTILIPLAHGGAHPIAHLEHTDGHLTGRLCGFADFMHATGPLYGDHPGTPRNRDIRLPPPTHTHPLAPAELTWAQLCDLTAYLAGHDPRTTCVRVEGLRGTGSIGLFDETTHSAAVVQTIAIHGTGPAVEPLVAAAAGLYRSWDKHGRPGVGDWRFETDPRTAADGTVMHVPCEWLLHSAGTEATSAPLDRSTRR